MDIKEEIKLVEEYLFNDEKLMKILPILKEEYWKIAKQGKKMEFLRAFHKCVSGLLSDTYPEKMKVVDNMEEVAGGVQDFFITDDYVYVSKGLVNHDVNPYLVLKSYLKELFIDANVLAARYADENLKKEMAYKVNLAASLFGEWDNFISDRLNPDFVMQPVVYDAYIKSLKYMKSFTKQIYNKFGMDKYIGDALMNEMEEEFALERYAKEVEENFKRMTENYKTVAEDSAVLQRLNDSLTSNNSVAKMSDDEFYGMFNMALMPFFSVMSRAVLYKEFLTRALDNSEDSQLFIDSCLYGTGEEDEAELIVINGKAVMSDTCNELPFILDELISFKLETGQLKELNDEKFIEEVKTTNDKLKELMEMEEDKKLQPLTVYLYEAFPNFEATQVIKKYYYEKINNAMKNNKITTRGLPALANTYLSKYDAFLKYIYQMSYEEVREKQIKELMNKKADIKGGR